MRIYDSHGIHGIHDIHGFTAFTAFQAIPSAFIVSTTFALCPTLS